MTGQLRSIFLESYFVAIARFEGFWAILITEIASEGARDSSQGLFQGLSRIYP